MTGDRSRPELSGAQKFWGLGAAILFLIAIGLLGYAIASGAILVFAVGWVLLQAFGYLGALRFAKGDLAHPLFRSQVMLHVIALLLIAALVLRS